MKHLFRKILRKFGFDIIRLSARNSDNIRTAKLFLTHRIDVVFDVGAGTGQYAGSLFEAGYTGKIVSFEPLSTAHTRLSDKSTSNPNWHVAERCAIGDKDGEIEINISENSNSSSVLPIKQTHLKAAPRSRYTGTETVNMVKLDTIAHNYYQTGQRLFLKLDVQGYEDRVLDGCGKLLAEAKGIQLEMSLVPLYREQKTFEILLERIEKAGFELYGLLPGFSDEETGQMLQVDGIFFRKIEYSPSHP